MGLSHPVLQVNALVKLTQPSENFTLLKYLEKNIESAPFFSQQAEKIPGVVNGKPLSGRTPHAACSDIE
ncbi:hypothetical protein EHN07_12865 [Buttiauxella warmboldiae]|uniref:Uncharacterized protein n=1 Tax=Buttiauxella warmboldiae TaxID=82993 RepID=A0A3N5DB62_9ENTR|nr:hypothetical protein [Buttiauxella warmboldiae]RPH25595.1 hypothetical protein EHN07_12865 [Buttiauxella warmboldiae]